MSDITIDCELREGTGGFFGLTVTNNGKEELSCQWQCGGQVHIIAIKPGCCARLPVGVIDLTEKQE